MQEFKIKFTTDITQHQRVMGEFRSSVQQAMGYAKKLVSVVGLTGIAGGSLGIGMLGKKIIKLGADMQDTRSAFETMLGSMEKGNQVLALLNKFSDLTPFDNKEVIQAGRSLLNVGVATTELTEKLTMLGDIASGAQQPLNDIVAIYAKSANKGKIAAEELNQLSERGVPIMAALAKMTGYSTAEIMKLGTQGKLSFGLMEEAMKSMTGKGGQYFGLMEKQSQNLNGLWAGVEVELEKIGIAIGEQAIPALTEAVQSLLDKINQMKETGQLDAIISKLADTIGKTVLAIRDLAAWLAKNREYFASIGKIGLYWLLWKKLNVAMTAVAGTMRAMRAIDLAGSFDNLRRSSAIFKVLTANISSLFKATGALRGSLSLIGGAAAAAFTGWEIGKRLADLLELEEAFTRFLMTARDKELAPTLNEPVKPSVAKRDLVADRKRQAELKNESQTLRDQIGNLEKAPATPENKSALENLRGQLAEKDKEAAELAAASQKYEEAAKKEIAEIENISKAQREAEEKRKALEKELNDLKVSEAQNIGTRRRPVQGYAAIGQMMSAANRGETSSSGKNQEKIPSRQENLSKELAEAKKTEAELQARFYAMSRTRSDYLENKNRLNAADVQGERETASKLSEVAKLRLAQEKEDARKRLEMERQVAEARKQLRKAQQQLEDDLFRDRMSDKIEKWRENIKGYQKQIDETEKKLSKLGLSVDEDILKTPEQILQAKKDEMLQAKIAAHNRGEKVTFTDEEKARIAQLQEDQKKAREAKKAQEADEKNIEDTEKEVSKLDKQRRDEERQERGQELDQRDKALTAAEAQLTAAKEANAPIVVILEKITDILKNGLPTETT